MPRKKNSENKKPGPKPKKGKGAKYTTPSTLTFRIDGDLRDKLQKIAGSEYTSESSLCNRYIAQGIEQDALARTKKIDRRLAALELTLNKDALQSAQGLVEQLGLLTDRSAVIESTLGTISSILDGMQKRIELLESDVIEDEDDDEDETDVTTPDDEEVVSSATPNDDDDEAEEDDDDVVVTTDEDDEEVAA